MTTKDEALKLALEALGAFEKDKRVDYRAWDESKASEAIAAIREALAEQSAQDEDQAHYKQVVDGVREAFDAKRKQQPAQQQEPVAEVKAMMTGGNVGIATVIHEIYSPLRERLQPGDKLYTSQPASKPWVGIDAGDWNKIAYTSEFRAGADWAEAKLREKNA